MVDKHPEARAAYARAKEGTATPADAALLAEAIDAMHPLVEDYEAARVALWPLSTTLTYAVESFLRERGNVPMTRAKLAAMEGR